MDDSKKYLLTTIDNPYNPWTNWDQWFDYDQRMGYCTCSYLARVMSVNDSMTEKEQEAEYNFAMDEIIKYDVIGKYAKISEGDTVPMGIDN